MHWRSLLKRFWPFFGYVLLIAVMFTTAALLGRYNRSKKLEAPTKSLDALKVQISQVGLAASGLADADGRQDTVASALARTENQLKSSLESAKTLLEEHKNGLATELHDQIAAGLDQHLALLNTYQSRYKQAGKAIQYNPSLDLDGLDLTNQEGRQHLQERAVAAKDNLAKLENPQSNGSLSTDKFSLSDVTKGNLSKIVDCFDRLADASNGSDSGLIIDVRNECRQLYPSFRQTLVNDLTSVFRTDQAKTNITELTDILTQL